MICVYTSLHLSVPKAQIKALPEPLIWQNERYATAHSILNLTNIVASIMPHKGGEIPPTKTHRLLERLEWLVSSPDTLKAALKVHGFHYRHGSRELKDWQTDLKTIREMTDFARVAGASLIFSSTTPNFL